jgi:hypothetical protein
MGWPLSNARHASLIFFSTRKRLSPLIALIWLTYMKAQTLSIRPQAGPYTKGSSGNECSLLRIFWVFPSSLRFALVDS